MRVDTDPIIGWRGWTVESSVSPARLKAMTWDYTWPAGARFDAVCDPICLIEVGGLFDADSCETSPELGCTCGIYAWRTRARTLLWEGAGPCGTEWRVVGEVALWGRVIEHEIGWRGQYAYPFSLEVSRRWASDTGLKRVISELREGYGVEVSAL